MNVLTLQGMYQERHEGVQSFLARLNGHADLCDLQVQCIGPECGVKVCYKDKFKVLQLVRGLSDKEVQTKVLAAGAAKEEGSEISLAEVVKLVESCEMGKSAGDQISKAGGVYRMSEHLRSKQEKKERLGPESGTGGKCGYCGRDQHPEEQCPAKDIECRKCKMKGHFAAVCKKKKDTRKQVSEVAESNTTAEAAGLGMLAEDNGTEEEVSDFFRECYKLSVSEFPSQQPVVSRLSGKPKLVRHQKCDRLGRWTTCRVEDHGQFELNVTVCSEWYQQSGLQVSKGTTGISTKLLADTGAQMCVSGGHVAKMLGLSRRDLLPAKMEITVANNAGLELLGAAFVTISSGGVSVGHMLYFAHYLREVFLSKEACRALGGLYDLYR